MSGWILRTAAKDLSTGLPISLPNGLPKID